jgi:hypothetical protein
LRTGLQMFRTFLIGWQRADIGKLIEGYR